MRILIYTFIVLSIFFFKTAIAAPAPDSLVINDSKKECGSFWAGDEYTRYELPSGWKSYGWLSNTGYLETPYGKCQGLSAPICCSELKLKYVGAVKGTVYSAKGTGVSELPFSDPSDSKFLKLMRIVFLVVIGVIVSGITLIITRKRSKSFKYENKN